MDVANEARIAALLAELTLEEQVALLAGANFWATTPIPRVGIPAIKVSDGPNGARGGGSLIGGVSAASFPVAIALAASWNTALVAQIGAALAEEAQSKGAQVLLAPTVNIHRSPLNGRNFECYSEDPYLSAQLAVAYITGLQSRGVAATIKHYIGNESEFQRNTISSEIDERALREIYLPPFAAAVKAGVWAVMSSYNKLNGTYVGEDPRLLTALLKQELGFDGLVMSDWFATRSTAAAAAGMDLEMPGPPRYRGPALLAAVQSGEVPAAAVRNSAARVLRLIARVGAFDQPPTTAEQAIDRPEHRALIRQAGAEGIVLLKNTGILPLNPAELRSIAVIGPNATTAQIMGGGSAQLNPHYRVTPYEAIKAQVGAAVELAHAIGCENTRYVPLLRGAGTIAYFNGRDLSGPVVAEQAQQDGELMWLHDMPPGVDRSGFSARLSFTHTAQASGEYALSLVSAGRSRLLVDGQPLIDNWSAWQPGETYFGAGSDQQSAALVLAAGTSYAITVEYASPDARELGLAALRVGLHQPLTAAALDAAVALAASADVALLFVGLNGEWDTEGLDRPHMDLVGQQDALIARVAAANPRTVVVLQSGGPLTMPWLDQVAGVLQAWYPGQECGNAIADVLFGAVNPSGKLPQTFPQRLEDNPAYGNYPGAHGKVHYAEGIFVGYRHYERHQIAPLFPFGHGLSYTSFGYANLHLSSTALSSTETLTVSVDITNTGARAGQEIVQLYIRDVVARLDRPEKELKGFVKIALEPGETRTVRMMIDSSALSFYDVAAGGWAAEPGAFVALVGSSAQDIRAQAGFELRAG